MKILRVEKFGRKKNDEKKSATSPSDSQPTPENSKESEWVEEKIEGESTDIQPLEKPENVADSDGTLRDEQPEHSESEYRSKGEQLPGDKQELQAFFENIQYDNPDQWSKGENPDQSLDPPIEEQIPNEVPLPQDMNLPGDALKQGPEENPEHSLNGERQTRLLSASLQTNARPKKYKSSKNAVITIKGSASGNEPRSAVFIPVSKHEDRNEENPKRKRKGPDSTGGAAVGPPVFSLRDIFHVIFKRKFQILLFFAAVFVTVAIGTYLTTPVYNASAQILIKLGREDVFIPTSGEARPFVSSSREERINSEIEILKSRALAEKVVTAIGPTVIYEKLKEDKSGIFDRLFPSSEVKLSDDEKAASVSESAVTYFLDSLAIEAISKSNVVTLTFSHSNPQMAAMVVNKLAKMYLDHRLDVHKTTKSLKFFKEQSQLLQGKMMQSEEELKALKEKYNITNLDEERAIFLRQIADLRAELNKTISQQVETEKRISLTRQQLDSTPSSISHGEESDRNEALISALEARLVELQLKEKELLTKYTDQSRLVQSVKEEIQIVSEKLAEQEKRDITKKRSGANPTYQKLQETLFDNEAELNAVKAKAETQKAQLIDYQKKMDKLNEIEVALNQLKQQVDINQENYRLYLAKFEESRISDAMDSEKIASVSVIQFARAPNKPVSPKKELNMILAVFLGTIGGLGLAFFMEYLDDRVEKIDDVEKELNLPVLASIPVFERKAAGTGRF